MTGRGYDTTEKKLKREFEVFGSIKKVGTRAQGFHGMNFVCVGMVAKGVVLFGSWFEQVVRVLVLWIRVLVFGLLFYPGNI